MTSRVGNGPSSIAPSSAGADRARVFTSLVMAESRGAQRTGSSASNWSGILGGKPVQATPSGPRAANGDQRWTVTWLADGKTPVSVDTTVREQFGPQHVQPGTPVRRALESQWTASQTGPKAFSSPDGFHGRPVEAKPKQRVPGTDKYVWEISVGAAAAKGAKPLAAMASKPATATIVVDGAFDPSVLTADNPATRELKAKLGIV